MTGSQGSLGVACWLLNTTRKRFYNEHLAALVELALASRVGREEAEELAHQVLVASLLHLPELGDVESWLAGSLRSAVAHRNESRMTR